MTSTYLPDQLVIEKSVRNSIITRNARRHLSHIPVNFIDSIDDLRGTARRQTPTISVGKRTLVLSRHRGTFFKYCPAAQGKGTADNVCCNYFVLNFAANCHMECTYCYLQSYLNFPYLVVHANLGELLGELEGVLDNSRPGAFWRIGTGELSDSLALDPITGYARELVSFFSERRNAVLELKTKSDCVEGLLGLEHGGRTVVAWSLNTPYIQQREEHKTASIESRLVAAQQCVAAGYRVAFHFDPLIHYPRWEKEYCQLVEEVFDRIPGPSIAWLSVGALRMGAGLRERIRSRFPHSFLPLGELVPCPDGKLRYVKSIRAEMYLKMVKWLRARAAPRTGLYACMERPEVWERIFEARPPGDEEIGKLVTAGIRSDVVRSDR